MANKGGHIPAQTATRLLPDVRDPPEPSDHLLDGMADILQGGRDEMRGFGGHAGFTPFFFCSFALDAGFSTLPQLMMEEAYLDANNVVFSSKSTGNSGSPLGWQGRLLTN